MGRARRADAPVDDAGRATIVAADQVARGILRAGPRPDAMADRADLLARLCLASSRPGVTGVLGTANVLEDLPALGVLDDRAAFGSMSRGRIRQAAREVDDRFTGSDADAIAAAGRALAVAGAIGLVVGGSLLDPPVDDLAAAVEAPVAPLPGR